MDTHGFIVRTIKRIGPVHDVSARFDERHGTVSWCDRNFISSHPFRATHESDRERQPILTESLILSYAGRIDNRQETIGLLKRPHLADATDGQILSEAYLEWGREFPRNVIGEYCFAIIDRRDGTMTAGRDALGVTRLYYHEDGDTICVASELGLILKMLPNSAELDRKAVVEYIFEAGAGRFRSGRTIYKGVRQVRPAHILTQRGSGVSTNRYWEPNAESRIVLRRDEDYDDTLRYLLTEAVRSALRCNGRVCLDVSGGLDSSTVASKAACLVRETCTDLDVAAFSAVASHTDGSDESHFQRDMLTAYSLSALTHDMDRNLDFETLESNLVTPSTAIISGSSANAVRALFEAANIRVQLTGMGGDQVFCGDQFPPLHLAERLQTSQMVSWIRDVREWATQGERSVWDLVWRCSRGSLTNVGADKWNDGSLLWCATGFRQEVIQHARETTQSRSHEQLFASAAREFQYRNIIAMQPSTTSRLHSWERRHPLLYRPLVEFMLAIPWQHKIAPGEDRVIQRRALRGLVPESIRTRKDKGDHTPIILRGIRENWSKVRPFIYGERLASLGVVEPKLFQTSWERLRHGLTSTTRGTDGPFLVAALSLEMWLSFRE